MVVPVQIKRTLTVTQAFPTLLPGQLAYNNPRGQLAIGDFTTGAPQDLLAVRFFSTNSTYLTNDFVTHSGALLRALVDITTPGAFNGAQWQGAADGVAEAPVDGNSYFRKNAAWFQATLAALGGVPEAPNNANAYGRKAAAWVQLNATDVVWSGGTTVAAALATAVQPSDLTSDNVSNESTVSGGLLTAALNNLLTAIGLKAPSASPTFTGTVLAPTATPGDATTKVATTAFVDAVRAALTTLINGKAATASPSFTGSPKAPTPSANDNSTNIATTAYVDAESGTRQRRTIITRYDTAGTFTHTRSAGVTQADIYVMGTAGPGIFVNWSTGFVVARSSSTCGGWTVKYLYALPATATVIVGNAPTAGAAGADSSFNGAIIAHGGGASVAASSNVGGFNTGAPLGSSITGTGGDIANQGALGSLAAFSGASSSLVAQASQIMRDKVFFGAPANISGTNTLPALAGHDGCVVVVEYMD